MRIYISTSSIESDSIEEVINNFGNIGIRNIELSGGTKYSENILGKLKIYKEKFSLNFLVHNYFPPPQEEFVLNIASSNEKIRMQSINFIKKSIFLTKDLGADHYTFHAGYAKDLQLKGDEEFFTEIKGTSVEPEKAESIMFKSIKEINDYAGKLEVKIGIENLFPLETSSKASLLCTDGEIFNFLNYFSGNDISLLLDLGHLSISANHFSFDKSKFIQRISKEYQDKILAIHLSANNGKIDQHFPLEKGDWQLEAVRSFDLKRIPLTIEGRKIKTQRVLEQLYLVEDFLRRSN